ncbi:hypothetical protein EW146_g10220, partial [Bondarzewia mesenterica]
QGARARAQGVRPEAGARVQGVRPEARAQSKDDDRNEREREPKEYDERRERESKDDDRKEREREPKEYRNVHEMKEDFKMDVYKNEERVNQCNAGPIQCCNTVEKASSESASKALGLLGIVLNDLNTPIGLNCDAFWRRIRPINIII